MTTVTNRSTNKIHILKQQTTNQTMSYNWKVDSTPGASGSSSTEMTAQEKKNEATRRYREKEKLQSFKVQADIVNLEWQKKDLEKKLAFESGRTQAMSSQVNFMSNTFPSVNNDPNIQKAKECLAKANENYWTKK